MTGAYSHEVWFDEDEYTITNWTDPLWVNPEDYGIKAQLYSTAATPGYMCSFEISDRRLRLKDFVTYNSAGEYPTFNGREPILPKHKWGDCEWKDVGLEIPYTGILGLSKDDTFMDEYYIHMGLQPLFCWGKSVAVSFVDGEVQETFDMTGIADRLRGEYDYAEEDETVWRLRRAGARDFAFLENEDCPLREAVDARYTPRYSREKGLFEDVAFRRLSLGEAREGIYFVNLVPYVPRGCASFPMGKKEVEAAVDCLAAGRMTREDAADFSALLLGMSDKELCHASVVADMGALHDIGFLFIPRYDEHLSESELNRMLYHHVEHGVLEELRGLVEKAF